MYNQYDKNKVHSEEEINEIEGRLVPTAGTCGVMGTASTMACMAEALGMMLPGGATIPAVAADRLRHAEASGARAMELAEEQIRPSDIITSPAIANALCVLLAVGGSEERQRYHLVLPGFDVNFTQVFQEREKLVLPMLF